MTNHARLEIDSLRIAYPNGHVALDGLSLRLDPGEIVAVVGESGSGKSTLGLAAMGLLPEGTRVTADRFEVVGADVIGLRDRDWRRMRGRDVAMVFQEPLAALDPTMTVGRQIAEAVRRYVRGRQQVRARVLELMRDVRLPDVEDLAGRYPHELSGGQRQRIVIAIALAGEPDMIIADEPTTALDVTVQKQILDLLRHLCARDGISLLFITHNLGVVAEIADRVTVLFRGEQLQTGRTDDVLFRYPEPYTRALLAATPAAEHEPRSMFEIPEFSRGGDR